MTSLSHSNNALKSSCRLCYGKISIIVLVPERQASNCRRRRAEERAEEMDPLLRLRQVGHLPRGHLRLRQVDGGRKHETGGEHDPLLCHLFEGSLIENCHLEYSQFKISFLASFEPTFDRKNCRL